MGRHKTGNPASPNFPVICGSESRWDGWVSFVVGRLCSSSLGMFLARHRCARAKSAAILWNDNLSGNGALSEGTWYGRKKHQKARKLRGRRCHSRGGRVCLVFYQRADDATSAGLGHTSLRFTWRGGAGRLGAASDGLWLALRHAGTPVRWIPPADAKPYPGLLLSQQRYKGTLLFTIGNHQPHFVGDGLP